MTGLFLIPFVTFIVASGGLFPGMYFPYITGKNFAFRIVIEILIGLYILLAVRDPKYRPRSSVLMWAVFAFVVWVGVATIFSADPTKSFWSNFERMEGYVTLLHLFGYFVIAGALLTADRLWERFFQTSIGVSALQGLIALFQVFGWVAISTQSGPRVDTTFGNATYLAVYMLFNIFLTLFMLVREKHSRSLQAFYGSALLLQFVALFFTETRGALLGVLGGLIVAALYTAWQAKAPEWKTLRKASWGTLAGLAILIVIFFGDRNTTFIQKYAGTLALGLYLTSRPDDSITLSYLEHGVSGVSGEAGCRLGSGKF